MLCICIKIETVAQNVIQINSIMKDSSLGDLGKACWKPYQTSHRPARPAIITTYSAANDRKIIRFRLQAWNLAQLLFRVHSFEKERWPFKKSRWRPFLKMAANLMNGRYENISKLCFQHYKLELLMPKGHFCEKIVDN